MRRFQWKDAVSSGPLGVFTLGESPHLRVAARSMPTTARADAQARLLEDARWSTHVGEDVALQPLDAQQPLADDDDAHPQLILRCDGAVPLALLLASETAPATTLLWAAAIARTVARLHARGFVHAALSPQSIWYDRTEARARVAAMDLSFTDAGDLRPQPWRSRRVDLRYLAPELWGTSLDVDRRADLYALGVVFFELFTGRLPFADLDSVALRHGHSAIEAPRMSSLRDGLAPQLVDIVASLLAKDPQYRYGSAWGLAEDLDTLGRHARTPGAGAAALGGRHARDIPRRPDALIGRERELEALGAVLAPAPERGDRPSIVTVRGPSGLGKTVLVTEALARHGTDRLVAWGRSDQSGLAEPLSSLAAPLQALLEAIEAQADDATGKLRSTLATALDGTADALLRTIPALGSWLEPSAAHDVALSDRAERRRLHMALQGLLEALADTGRRPVLVLDDLQWADPATLTALEWLAESTAFPALTVIGLYRDDEIVEGSAVARTLTALVGSHAAALDLPVAPLSADAVATLLCECLGEEPAAAQALTASVLDHSRGNPLFVVEEIQELWRSGALRRDADSGRWTWDPQALAAVPYSTELASLMHARFRHLEETTREVMAVAACFGRGSDHASLAAVLGLDHDEVDRRLAPALRDGLLVGGGGRSARVEFRHDQMQAAAYDLLSEARRRSLHRSIADRILGEDPDDDSHLPEAIGHLNVAAPLLVAEGRGQWLAGRNLAAARRAMRAAAFGEAWAFLRAGLALTESSAWSHDYEQTRDLHLEGARAACMAGAGSDAVTLARSAREHARDRGDRVSACELHVEACKVVDRFDEAIDVAIQGLTDLGVALPPHPSTPAALGRLLLTHARLRVRGQHTLAALAPMGDPSARAAMRILAQLGTITFLSRPNLFLAVVDAQLRLTLARGTAPESAFATALYGVVLSGRLQQLGSAGAVARAVATLLEQTDAAERPRAMMPLWIYVLPWHRALAESLPVFREQCRRALAVGDPEFANYHACGYAAYGVHTASSIGEAVAELEWMRTRVVSIGQERQYAADIYHQFLLNLACEDGDPLRFAGPVYDETTDEPAHAHALEMHGHIALVRLMAAVLFDRPENHRRFVAAFRNAAGMYSGMYVLAAFLFWEAVAVLRFDPGPRARALARRTLVRLRLWQRHCHGNFAHKATLVRAELARSRGRWASAQRLYEEAAAGALAGGFALEAGLALEGAGLSASRRGLAAEATHYHQRAERVFADLGARAKLRDLRIRGFAGAAAPADAAAERQPAAADSWSMAPDTVDLAGVLTASQALSEGMDLAATIDRILRTVVGVAGAERGMLLERRDDGFALLALADTHGAAIQVTVHPDGRAMPAELPGTILREVTRSGRPVILTDSAAGPAGSRRRGTGPRSLLCCPLRRGERNAGIIYLEHSVRADAFGEREAETVRLLSTQAAISLDNARLYQRQLRLSEGARRFVPEEFLDLLGKGDVDDVVLSDHIEAEMTILVCDIRGFTTTTEHMTPEQSFAWVNRFFALAGPVVRRHGGFVMKYMGDGFMGVFPHHADDAAATATALLDAAAAIPELAIGIGLHTGPVAVGAVGERSRIQADVMSDVANVATRLESLTRTHGVDVLLSEATRRALSPPWRQATRSLGRVTVKGRSGELDIHALEAADAAAQQALP